MLNTRAIQVVALSASADFDRLVRAAFGGPRFDLSIAQGGLLRGGSTFEVGDAGAVVVDLDSTDRQQLLALDLLMRRIDGSAPVIAVTQVLHESVPRKLVQMRVADFLAKPVTPADLLAACIRVVRTPMRARVFTFMPAVGGAGATTTAIQAALTLHRGGGRREAEPTSLVDLNLTHGACADYLDLEPRLDLSEIERCPERLDAQLLAVMLAHHPSGLSIIAAPKRLTSIEPVNPTVVTRLLDLVSSSFDNVVIDMPRTWSPWTDDVLHGSDQLFIVSEATVPALRTAKQLVTAASQRVSLCAPPLVIVNRFQQRWFSSGLRRTDIRRALGESLGGIIPSDHSLVREAIDRGVPLEEVKRGNRIAAAIKKLMLNRDCGGSRHAMHHTAAVAEAA